MKHKKNSTLKIAFLAGTLQQGGAEKQLFYMAKALHEAGALVTVFSLSSGEFYDTKLTETGIPVVCCGKRKNPLVRLAKIISALKRFQPHIIQSSHFYMNLYSGIAGWLLGTLSIGAMRGDLDHAASSNKFWAKWLLQAPKALIINSRNAYNCINSNKKIRNLTYLLANVLDVSELGDALQEERAAPGENITAISVGNLRHVKRFDRFLKALAMARKQVPSLRGIIIGDGPEKPRLEGLAQGLGLFPDGVVFSGQQDDVRTFLQQADIFVLSSDHEGFPNVLLEAMAAGLPVVTTPAGDAGLAVCNGINGYVVAYGDIVSTSSCMVRLARSPELRRQFGRTGKRYVEKKHNIGELTKGLFEIYHDAALKRSGRVVPALQDHLNSTNEVQG